MYKNKTPTIFYMTNNPGWATPVSTSNLNNVRVTKYPFFHRNINRFHGYGG